MLVGPPMNWWAWGFGSPFGTWGSFRGLGSSRPRVAKALAEVQGTEGNIAIGFILWRKGMRIFLSPTNELVVLRFQPSLRDMRIVHGVCDPSQRDRMKHSHRIYPLAKRERIKQIKNKELMNRIGETSVAEYITNTKELPNGD